MHVIRLFAIIGVTVASLLLQGSAHGSSDELATSSARAMATPCAPGTPVLDTQFGPRFAWTLHAESYPNKGNCVYVAQNRSLNGKMVLKTKLTINGITTRDTQRCFGCAAVTFGPSGYDKVVVKAIAYKRGGDVAYTTGWRVVRR